eukprot:4399451-Pleurochrysis_carterae.AAC.1
MLHAPMPKCPSCCDFRLTQFASPLCSCRFCPAILLIGQMRNSRQESCLWNSLLAGFRCLGGRGGEALERSI